MSSPKGKVQELVELVLMVAGIIDVLARVVSAVAGRLCRKARASTHDQLKHLHMLVLLVHSVVTEADRVGIPSATCLHDLVSSFRDAALDGEEVLRSFDCQSYQETSASRNTLCGLWNSAKRVLIRAAKSFLFRVDPDADRLNGTVARLERASSLIGDFLRLLKQELRGRPTGAPPAPAPYDDDNNSDGRSGGGDDDNDNDAPPLKRTTRSSAPMTRSKLDGSEVELAGAHIGNMIRTGLMMVTANIRQAIVRLRSAPPAWRLLSTPEPEPDARRLGRLVIRIRAAVKGTEQAEFHGNRWLAKWRRELQAVADRAHVVLTAVRASATPAEAATWIEELRTTAHAVETAAAHLHDFLALVRINGMAHASSSRPSKSSSSSKKNGRND